jgi:hypothetical protein
VRKLQSEGVLGNPATLFNLANTAISQVTADPPQVVLSKTLANPQRMVQIAMAVRSVPYQDIVVRAVPHGVRDRRSRVDPVTSAAKVLFDALANNQPIQLTGSTSDGYGTEVVGEATPPADPGATPSPTATGDAGATAAARRRRRPCSCRRPSPGRPRPRSPAPSPSADRAVDRMRRHPVRQGCEPL